MAEYVASGATDAMLAPAEALVGRQDLRFVCITLLSWLKSRARFPRMTTMRVGEFGSGRESAVALLRSDPAIAAVFCLDEGRVSLRGELAEADIAAALEMAQRLYRPRRFVTSPRRGPGA